MNLHAIEKRLKFEADGQYHLRFDPPLAYMVGFDPGKWFKFDKRKKALYPVDIIYCSSDLVSHHLVGDAYALLLRTV